AHGAEPTRGHPAVGLLEMEELRRPHLVLADFGRDIDVAALGELVEPLDRVLRLDDLVRTPVGKAPARAPAADLLPPGGQRRLVGYDRPAAPQAHHVLEHMAPVPDDAEIDPDVLVDPRRIGGDRNLGWTG